MTLHAFRASPTFTTFVVCISVFTDVLLQNLVVPVLPYALRSRVGIEDEGSVQKWSSILLSSFGAAFMLGSIIFGYFSDHYPSRRTPYILGLLLTGGSTLLFALGMSIPILLGARILEGLSTGVVATVGAALIRDVVGKERLGRAMGYTSMAVSMGLLLGPVIGGVLYEFVGYVETFLPAVALVGAEVVLRLMIIEDGGAVHTGGAEEHGKRRDDDRSGKASDSTGLEDEVGSGNTVSTTPCTSEDGSPHLSPQILKPDCEPLLPKGSSTLINRSCPRNTYHLLLTSPRFLLVLLTLLSLTTIANGFDATLVPYLSSNSLSPLSAATLFLALALPMLGAPLSGHLADAYGPKPVILVGLIMAIPSLSALALIREDTSAPLPKLFALFMLIGTALALSLTPLRVEAARVVDVIEARQPGCFGERGAYARAFGLTNGMVAAGGMVGPLVAGFLKTTVGWDGMAVCMGVAAMVCAVGVLVVMQGKKDGGKGR